MLEQNQEPSQETSNKSDQRMKNPTDVEDWQDVALSGHKIRKMKETSSAHSLYSITKFALALLPVQHED